MTDQVTRYPLSWPANWKRTPRQAFAGYTALPPATDAWWLVFNLPQTASLVQVEERFKELARAAHPDVGGTHNDMARLTEARANARKALSS